MPESAIIYYYYSLNKCLSFAHGHKGRTLQRVCAAQFASTTKYIL